MDRWPPPTPRHEPAFAHHADLPIVEHGPCRATVLIGNLAGERSPSRREMGILGVELSATTDATEVVVPVDARTA